MRRNVPSSTTDAGAARVAVTGRRGVLASMCLSLVLVVGSVSALNLALPSIAVELGASNSALTWIADGYTVALAALVLPLGALGDRYGRRHVLVGGTIVFAAAAFAAATADSTGALIAYRVLMGAGAAGIMPGTLSTITASFPPEERRRGVATWAGFASAGAIIGLLAAGALLERWGWPSVFVLSGAVAAVSVLTALAFSPNTAEADDERTPFDVTGSVLSSVGIGALVFAIIEGAETGWTHGPTLISGAVAIAALGGYVVAGLRNPHPLLDPRLFRLRGFSSGAMTILVQFMAVFGFFFVGLQFLQLILDASPLRAALGLVPVAIVVLPTSQLTPRLTSLVGLRRTMSLGLVLLAAGMGLIATLGDGATYLQFLAGLLVAGLGIGVTSSTGTAAIVGALPTAQQGVASAMNDTTRELGAALGIALMGAAYGTTYRDALPAAPAGSPRELVDAVQDSAAGGLAVADRLGPLGTDLRVAVRHAFMEGLSTSSTLIAAIVLGAAILVAIAAPRRADDGV